MSGEPAAGAAQDPALSAIRSAISSACMISEGSAWLMAWRVQAHLDAAGFKVIGARTPDLRESRTVAIELATYQQILGERNQLLAKVAELNGQIERYRDMVGEAEADVVDLDAGAIA